ncbi:MAG: preprotein translocase subunit SecY [Candidatus Eisenbacteria bacterium]|jgi:preprotein translocase subunit SecY|uniref:Protein translocase subunit SecY n=1 Tax=Eiseniibacteriota bacterium TaxID=2212470 RepID=A0A538TRU3_UNCEI|nr:MAG: preprotein translocase subunit SecY [Candidatus Eisenbacteria bacterium]
MFEKLQNIFRIPELKRRVLFTVALLCVYRLGGHVPTPGVNSEALVSAFASQANSLFGLYDLFVGGSFQKATVFALGIMPYISVSIIFQLLGAVIPYFEKLQKEGEEGRKKITQYTRVGTVALAAMQSLAFAKFLESMGSAGVPVVPHPGFGFQLMTMITQTAGTIMIMWLGEQITDKGIGNGISLIIFIGIVARFPADIINSIRALRVGTLSPIVAALMVAIMVGVIAAVVAMTQAQRKIPVQYAKRVVGRKMYGGQSTHIPLRVNTAGVIPIIFAQSLIMLPSTLAIYFHGNAAIQGIAGLFAHGTWVYVVVYSLTIIFFTYFYTAIVLNPIDMADNMKKYGGFVPGIRPGRKTAEYIDRILSRITLPGAVFLALIAVLPDILIRRFNVPFYFGGTSVLIVVGVALDTLQQIESHLIMRHYEGFVTHGKMRGRR